MNQEDTLEEQEKTLHLIPAWKWLIKKY